MIWCPTAAALPLTAETISAGPSTSLSAPWPLSANTLPVFTVVSAVAKSSGCATGASSTGTVCSTCVCVAVSAPPEPELAPSLNVSVSVRSAADGFWLGV